MSRSFRRHGVLLAVCLILASARARAADPPDSSPNSAAHEAAQRHFAEGVRLLREGKRTHDAATLERAYTECKTAYGMYPTSKASLSNLIESELSTRRELDAMGHLRVFVRQYGEPDEQSDYKASFVAQWELAFKATGHLSLEAPPGAYVMLDGHPLEPRTLAETIDVTPGHHVVESPGSDPARRDVDAPAGAVTRVPLPPASTSAPPSPSPSPPPSATSSPAAAETHDHAEAHYWRPKTILVYSLAGAAAAVAVTSIIFNVKANSDKNDQSSLIGQVPSNVNCASSSLSACENLRNLRDSHDREATLATVGYIGTAVLGAGAVVVAFAWNDHADRHGGAGVRVAPTLAGGPGVQLAGQF